MTKAVILAGGLGTRISEETGDKPKPMVEIGGFPVLWHILKCYAANGVSDFVVCCGYRGYVIKEYFRNYALHMSDVSFNMRRRLRSRMVSIGCQKPVWRNAINSPSFANAVNGDCSHTVASPSLI